VLVGTGWEVFVALGCDVTVTIAISMGSVAVDVSTVPDVGTCEIGGGI
jgi:hypothetical protein